jgi:hypothetical protein
MYALLSKLAEIVASFATRFFVERRVSQDAEIVGEFIRLILALQDVCARGERILGILEGFVSGATSSFDEASFKKLIDEQREALNDLGRELDGLKALLATMDAQLSLDISRLVDAKSGILTRWQQQVDQSHFSTTTIFFLSNASLERLIKMGGSEAGSRELTNNREDFVFAVADRLRDTRSREVRDIRSATEAARRRITEDIKVARADLRRARDLCSRLRDSAENALGKEPFAKLRRKLERKKSSRTSPG